MLITKGYMVLGCGCTDCFPNAIFFDAEEAEAYAITHLTWNPERFVIKEIDITSLNLKDD